MGTLRMFTISAGTSTGNMAYKMVNVDADNAESTESDVLVV